MFILKFIMKGKEGKGMWSVFEEIWELGQFELRVDEGRGKMKLRGRWGSGSTKEWEKYRLEADREDSNKLKSDAGVRLVNIRLQSLEFYVESQTPSFCLQLILLICLLLIDVTQRSVLSASSSKERRRKQELVQRRQESSPSVLGWLPWVWSERLRTQLFLLLLL